MIILLGASGYIGQAFEKELRQRGIDYLALSRGNLNYARYDLLLDCLRKTKPDFLINAAGFTGQPNVDACETAWADTVKGNILLAQCVAHACVTTGTPWGQVSSGCIYAGAKVTVNGQTRTERDLSKPGLRSLLDDSPEAIQGFTEEDEPNFSFRHPPCSFYSGTKALAEEAIRGLGRGYLWRLRIPFDELDGPRNYLSKIQRYAKVYDNVNSLSHRGDLVKACLDLWECRAPFGIYNMTNPGLVTTRQVVAAIQRVLKPKRTFEFWQDDDEFYRLGAKAPRSNCVLDVSKLLRTGVILRPVEDALEDALQRWRPA